MKTFHLCVLIVIACSWFSAKRGVHGSCQPNPCLNGGVCHPVPGTSTEFCLCPHNYTGSRICHASNITTTPIQTTPSATTSQSKTDRLPVREVTTQSSNQVIAESENDNRITSTQQTTSNERQVSTSSSGITTNQPGTATTSQGVVRASPTAQPEKEVASFTTTPGRISRAPSKVIPTKEKTFPTKGAKKKGTNYSLWFTWIVILLFVTSVLLLILAIALFISYGRVRPYDQGEERDSQDYPPEEDDLNGRKQVFNLKFT